MTEVQVEELCTRTVNRMAIIRPTIGLASSVLLWKMVPEKQKKLIVKMVGFVDRVIYLDFNRCTNLIKTFILVISFSFFFLRLIQLAFAQLGHFLV